MVFWLPTSSSRKQTKQLTISEWVRGVSPIGVGFNPDVPEKVLQALKKSVKLLIVTKRILSNKEGKVPLQNNTPARMTIVFRLFYNYSKFGPHKVDNAFDAITIGQNWVYLGSI